MSVRPRPAAPFNDAEKKVIAERQAIVRERVADNIRSSGHVFALRFGEHALRHQLNVARAAIQRDGLYCIRRKTWREIAWELRFPPSVFARWHNQVVLGGFAVTTPTKSGTWQFALSDRIDIRTPAVFSDQRVMEWLGLLGGEHGYPGHVDPYWAPPSTEEMIGDHAHTYDRSGADAWRSISETKWDMLTTWYPAMVGAAWWFAQEPAEDELPRTLRIGNTDMDADDVVAWCLAALDKWAPRRLFNVLQPVVATRLDARQLVDVSQFGSASSAASGVTEDRWNEWKGASYTAALTEGNRHA